MTLKLLLPFGAATSLTTAFELESQLAQAQIDARERSTPVSTHLLELEQDLRHIRATEVWIEARFVRAGAAAR